ncbi:MAG TPA: heavy metal-associated domain-containing protein, partial [Tepidisphaeraceae bacterium]|nr:heavy metal-associated domain-containing protein [Tepidisphaeraceae bacterium]
MPVDTLSQSGTATLDIGGMTCASCVSHVSKAAGTIPGVQSFDVNLARGNATVRFSPDQTDPKAISDAITAAGYPAAPRDVGLPAQDAEAKRLERQMHEARAWRNRAIVGILLWLPLE